MTKTWFITGSSSGFGHELVKQLAEKGEKVVATARTVSKLSEFEGNDNVKIVELDVTKKDQIQDAVKQALEWQGKIDVLINNAGFGNLGAIEETPESDYRAMYETNVFGLVNVTSEILPHMRKEKSGHILNISSVGGLVSMPGLGPYCSTKFAVEGISEALAAEVAPLGIKVNIIEPGAFKTGFVGAVLKANEIEEYNQSTQEVKGMVEQMKDNAPGDPAKAAQAMISVVESGNASLRIPLGNDAMEWSMQKAEGLKAQLVENEKLSRSTDFSQ